MDIIEISDPHQITLMVKQEDCEVTVDDCHLNILEVKEETENTSVNFEKVFLPEICDDVSMETPFFDYNKYNRKCELTEEVKSSISTASYPKENINQNVNTCYQYKQTVHERYREEQITFNQICKSNYKYDVYENNPRFNKHNSGENSDNSNLQFISMHQDAKVVQPPAQFQENNGHYIHNISPNTNVGCKEIMQPIRNNGQYSTTKRRLEDADEDCKYKCHLCKRPRAFYTLEAVNNHLKFEHICVFSNSKLKDINSLVKDKNYIISSDLVQKLE